MGSFSPPASRPPTPSFFGDPFFFTSPLISLLMLRVFVENPHNLDQVSHRDSLINKLNANRTLDRSQADLIFILISENDGSGNLSYLTQTMKLSKQETTVFILIPSGKKITSMDFLRQVDGWIFGCRLPKKIPTPRVMGGDFVEILKSISSIVIRSSRK